MLKTYDFHSFIQRPHFSQIAKSLFRASFFTPADIAPYVVSSTNRNLTETPTAICKSGHKIVLLKKRKMTNFWKKKKGEGLEISPSTLG